MRVAGGYVAEKSETERGWLFPVGDEVGELGYVEMFTDMFDAIDQGREPVETLYDGYVVNAVMDACYRSAAERQWTDVELDWRGGEHAAPHQAGAHRGRLDRHQGGAPPRRPPQADPPGPGVGRVRRSHRVRPGVWGRRDRVGPALPLRRRSRRRSGRRSPRPPTIRRVWPWLRQFDGERLDAGEVWRCAVRAPLTYTLRFTIRIDEVAAPEVVAATVAGDIAGTARLDVAADGDGSALRLRSDPGARGRAFALLAGLAGPLARRSHDWILDTGAAQFRGLVPSESS